MTEPIPNFGDYPDPEGIFLLAQVNVILRWRRMIIGFCLCGGMLGLAAGMSKARLYRSEATFLPQASDATSSASGLALAASQLGVRLPSSSSAWGPPVYVALLGQRSLLVSVAADTFVVSEERGRRVVLMDLLKVEAPRLDVRLDRAVIALRSIVSSRELKPLGAVEIAVTTRWPSVSLAIVQRLVKGVQRFNVETRKSQAAAERQFVEARAIEAEHSLREAEDRLQLFLQHNRVMDSPQLAFDRDRLQRDVGLRQQIYSTLMQSREEARVREVRDTPVITVIEEPRLPALPESRRTLLKATLGTLGFGILGLVIAFLYEGLAGARTSSNTVTREFFRLAEDLTPRFLRRRAD